MLRLATKIIIDFIYDETQGWIKDDYYNNTVLTEDITSYDTTIIDKGNIARYYQIDRNVDVINSLLTLNIETLIQKSTKVNVNNSNKVLPDITSKH